MCRDTYICTKAMQKIYDNTCQIQEYREENGEKRRREGREEAERGGRLFVKIIS